LLSRCDCIAGIRVCAFTQNGHNAAWQDAHQCVAKVSSPSHPLPHCCSILLSVCGLNAGMRPCALTQNEHNAFRQDAHQCVAKVSSPSHPLPHSLLLDTTEAKTACKDSRASGNGCEGEDTSHPLLLDTTEAKTACKDPRASGAGGAGALTDDICRYRDTSAYVSIRQHTSAYVSIRQHTSAYVSIRQHTSAYVSERGEPEQRGKGLRVCWCMLVYAGVC
jgi:hypothetical protein